MCDDMEYGARIFNVWLFHGRALDRCLKHSPLSDFTHLFKVFKGPSPFSWPVAQRVYRSFSECKSLMGRRVKSMESGPFLFRYLTSRIVFKNSGCSDNKRIIPALAPSSALSVHIFLAPKILPRS